MPATIGGSDDNVFKAPRPSLSLTYKPGCS